MVNKGFVKQIMGFASVLSLGIALYTNKERGVFTTSLILYMANNVVSMYDREIQSEKLRKTTDLFIKVEMFAIVIIFFYNTYVDKLKFLVNYQTSIDYTLKWVVFISSIFLWIHVSTIEAHINTEKDKNDEKISQELIRKEFENSLENESEREKYYFDKKRQFIVNKSFTRRKG